MWIDDATFMALFGDIYLFHYLIRGLDMDIWRLGISRLFSSFYRLYGETIRIVLTAGLPNLLGRLSRMISSINIALLISLVKIALSPLSPGVPR